MLQLGRISPTPPSHKGVLDVYGDFKTWEILLQSIHNHPESYTSLHGKDISDLLELFIEAHKFCMLTLYHYAEECIMYASPFALLVPLADEVSGLNSRALALLRLWTYMRRL